MQEYGQEGLGWPLEGYGVHGYDTFPSKGINFQWRDEEGEKEGCLNWNAIEKELSVLIMTGEYYQPPKMLEIEKVAQDLYQLLHLQTEINVEENISNLNDMD